MESGIECAICLETVTSNRSRTLECGHSFHKSCIKRWFSKSLQCPCCRKGSIEALRSCRRSSIHVSIKKVLERGPFPDSMTDMEKICDVLGCQRVMTELGVRMEDRAFLLILADMANDALHFFDMLKRLSGDITPCCRSKDEISAIGEESVRSLGEALN